MLRRLGPYKITRSIGVGGQAEVLLGELEGPGGFVVEHALKVLKDPLDGRQPTGFPAARAHIAEARLLAHLAHPHTIAIHGLHQYDDRLVMVLEYVAGRSLGALLGELFRRKLTLPLAHALWITRCVLMALDRAHTLEDRRGQPLKVVHRDISPENVLLGYDGRVKLIDFGIAISRIASRDTQVGMVKGKLEYMSPEQAAGIGDVDFRTDLYSWGLVLYEMLTRHQVLVGDFNSALERARNPNIAPPRRRNPHLPKAVDELTMTALAPNRRERFSSAREMMLAAVEILHEVNNQYSGDELGSYVRTVLPKAYEADMRSGRSGGTQVVDEGSRAHAVPDDTQESATYVPAPDLTGAPKPSRRARRPPPPIPAEAINLARRIQPVKRPKRASGAPGASDTVIKAPPGAEAQMHDLLMAIDDIYDDEPELLDDAGDSDNATRVFKRHK